MGFSLFLSAVIIFWIYTHYYQRSKSLRNNRPNLPLVTSSKATSEGSLWGASIGDSTVNAEVAGFLLLRCSTNLFLKKDRRVLDSMAGNNFTGRDHSRHSYTHSKFLTALYNFGSLLAIIGQLFTIGALWWSFISLFQRYYRLALPQPTVQTLVKRGLAHNIVGDAQISVPYLIVNSSFYCLSVKFVIIP